MGGDCLSNWVRVFVAALTSYVSHQKGCRLGELVTGCAVDCACKWPLHALERRAYLSTSCLDVRSGVWWWLSSSTPSSCSSAQAGRRARHVGTEHRGRILAARLQSRPSLPHRHAAQAGPPPLAGSPLAQPAPAPTCATRHAPMMSAAPIQPDAFHRSPSSA